jgi:alpha-amylase/alpha-mannosidase (GH57 family)
VERYVCIHGHFYQPPRENPWLEAVEVQDSAHPYHDWNERITGECYLSNATSRILDGKGWIVRVQNNYSRISFNFGPTLLSWMEEKSPEVYGAVLAADLESQKNFSGHGSALAQVYNHMILPLANGRDKFTQILWGIRDFEHRFGRSPEGMWLSETAVDLETLDIMARLGIRFTILSPHQARQVRRFRGRNWVDVGGGQIDPSRAYAHRLPSGQRMNLFFYDGPISRAVAFEKLLSNGEQFAGRLMSAFSDTRTWPQLAHIATDGETYGHHHRFGEMALAYALHHIEAEGLARLTNYGEFLEKYPPTHEVRIFENSSWSCPHGVERWRGNCGCNSGMNPGWSQEWRAPLREALDWLRDALAPAYEQEGRRWLKDPWAARDDYIQVILDRSPERAEKFFQVHAAHPLAEGDRIAALKLLELQRHALLMYTSCGWFFDELSGIETVQVIQYAGRAIQLAEELWKTPLELQFLERLERAKSNLPEHLDGRVIYEKFAKSSMVNLEKVGGHYAVRSVFEPYAERDRIYSYAIDRKDFQLLETGKLRLGFGRGRFSSRITQESADLFFGVLHFEDHNLAGGVREFPGEEAYRALLQEISGVFSRGDLPETLRLLDRDFGKNFFSLKSLFRDEQREVLTRILNSTLAEAEGVYLGLYERHAALLRFLSDLGTPLPKSLRTAAEFALNLNLRRTLAAQEMDLARVRNLVEEARVLKVPLDGVALGHTLKHRLEELARQWHDQSTDLGLLKKLGEAVDLARSLSAEVDFWRVQNLFFEMGRTVFPERRWEAEGGGAEAKAWVEHFILLGEKLTCRLAGEGGS